MRYTAHLIGVGLPEVIRAVGASAKTGDLLVLSSQRSARFTFVDGRIVHATADNVERLGLRLVSAGCLTGAQLHEALSRQAQTTPVVALSTLLLDLEWVEESVLERETARHIVEVVREVLSWSDGTLLFEEGAGVGRVAILGAGVNVESLLLHASTTTDELRDH
ncbi:MAG: DUF4388 domain-containing protein [Planctomycetes bacterium]|nr:DUF4388 domain-containing protein [Planctomycetota bacterium]